MVQHYVFCQHGFMGTHNDFKRLYDHFKQTLSTTIVPLTANEGKTYDGLERGGHRCLAEIQEYMHHVETGEKNVSFVGHSMGGLILRWVLRQIVITDPTFWSRHNATLKRAVFIASPHAGISLRFPLIRTVSDLAMDSPVLLDLSDQYGQASLNAFEKGIVLYGNIFRDKLVSVESALLVHDRIETVSSNDSVMTITPYFIQLENSRHAFAPRDSIIANLENGVKNIQRFIVYSPPQFPSFLQKLDNSAHTRIIAHPQMDRKKVGIPMIQHLEEILSNI